MGDIQETIVEVLVASEAVGGQIQVINPDLGGVVESNQIVTLRGVVQLQVAENDIGSLLNSKATTGQACL